MPPVRMFLCFMSTVWDQSRLKSCVLSNFTAKAAICKSSCWNISFPSFDFSTHKGMSLPWLGPAALQCRFKLDPNKRCQHFMKHTEAHWASITSRCSDHSTYRCLTLYNEREIHGWKPQFSNESLDRTEFQPAGVRRDLIEILLTTEIRRQKRPNKRFTVTITTFRHQI